MPLITIITYTFNRMHLLQRAIESVLNQTFQDFEYVIINNGSTDNTGILLEEYKAKNRRINVITRYPNVVGLEFFILFKSILEHRDTIYYMQLDDDDYMEPNTVEVLYGLIKQYNADISSVGSVWVYSNGMMKNKYVFEGIYTYSRFEAMTELLKREKMNSAQGGKLYKKSLLSNVNLPYVEHYRDIHREYRVLNNIEKMVASGMPLYYFYRHGDNVSGLDTAEQITPVKMRQHLEANTMRTEWLTEHMPEIKDYVLYCELSFMISLYERIKKLGVTACFGIAEEMREALELHSLFLCKHDYCTEREIEILNSISNMT